MTVQPLPAGQRVFRLYYQVRGRPMRVRTESRMLRSSLGARRLAGQIGVETDQLAVGGSRFEGRVAGAEVDAHGFHSFDLAPVVATSSATHTANIFMFLLWSHATSLC
jgi:hypothetical protein